MKIGTLKITKPYHIYALVDNGEVFYIGFTEDVNKRFREHYTTKELYFYKPNSSIEVIATFYDKDLAKEYEILVIRKFIDAGIKLENKIIR